MASPVSVQQALLRPCIVNLKSARRYHSPKDDGIEAANAHVFDDRRRLYTSMGLVMLRSLQTLILIIR